MRRLSILMFSITLAASSQGCHKTLRHTAGVCDCYPPPVETLLQAPCPKQGHPGSPMAGAYAPAPHARHGATTLQAQPLPATNPAPTVDAPKESETIRVLPKIEEKEKDK